MTSARKSATASALSFSVIGGCAMSCRQPIDRPTHCLLRRQRPPLATQRRLHVARRAARQHHAEHGAVLLGEIACGRHVVHRGAQHLFPGPFGLLVVRLRHRSLFLVVQAKCVLRPRRASAPASHSQSGSGSLKFVPIRGGGAPKGATSQFPLPLPSRARSQPKSASPSGTPPRRFRDLGTVTFRTGWVGLPPQDRPAFAAFLRSPPAHSRAAPRSWGGR